ncbi:MAG: PIN domain-containing protein [Microgenomates group bacterium]
MKFFVDTNIFLRTLIREDEETYQDCYKFFEFVKLNKIKAVTSHIVLAEIAWTLSSYYGFSKKKVAQALKGIINLRGLAFSDSYQALSALDMFEQKPVKFIDALLASIKEIKEKKWKVVSYDRDFDKLGVVRIEPKEIIL